MTTAFIGNLGWGEIAIIAFIIILLFGGRKIPELMKGIGKGIRSFKQGMSEVQDEINAPVDSDKKSGDSAK